jgi:hypothetical protein
MYRERELSGCRAQCPLIYIPDESTSVVAERRVAPPSPQTAVMRKAKSDQVS